jgi:transposase
MAIMAFSKDYRERAVAYKDEGHTFKELKEAFKIPSVTYYLWKKNITSGYYDEKVKQVRKGKIDKDKLKELVLEKPDLYLREYAEEFSCTPEAIAKAFRAMNITRKKNSSHIVKNRKKSDPNS